MIKVIVNNINIQVKSETTVLQACEKAGFSVPRFCFHERLMIAGNCRMCLVEIEKTPKPIAACALPVSNGIKIFTETPIVKKARENVIEFLLVNHPLDCPVCDQGGECDLQNQSVFSGKDYSRSFIKQRSVVPKKLSSLIKIIITRCIHCTRCTRFFSEKAGKTVFNMLGRGKQIEIHNFTNIKTKNILSGNVIDLCPVGTFSTKKF